MNSFANNRNTKPLNSSNSSNSFVVQSIHSNKKKPKNTENKSFSKKKTSSKKNSYSKEPHQLFRENAAKSFSYDCDKILDLYAQMKQEIENLRKELAPLEKENTNILHRLVKLREENEMCHSVLNQYLPLEETLRNPKEHYYFYNYCKRQCEAENLEFYLAVRSYRKLMSSQERAKQAKNILEEFVREEATQSLNITLKERQDVEKAFEDAQRKSFVPKSLFDPIQTSVRIMLQNTFWNYFRQRKLSN